ncbi:uncharacterized protein LOC135398003 [Ornithodoros turicata]
MTDGEENRSTTQTSSTHESADSPFSPSPTFALLRSQEACNETPTPPLDRPTPKRRKTAEDNSLVQILNCATQNMQNGARCTRPHLDAEDDVTMFLLSMREILKSFDLKQRMIAQMRMQEVLFSMRFNE